MDLTQFVIGVAIAIATVAAFVYMIKKQDEFWDKKFGSGDGSLRV